MNQAAITAIEPDKHVVDCVEEVEATSFLSQSHRIGVRVILEQIRDKLRPKPAAKEREIMVGVTDRPVAEVDDASEASCALREKHVLGPEVDVQRCWSVDEVAIVFRLAEWRMLFLAQPCEAAVVTALPEAGFRAKWPRTKHFPPLGKGGPGGVVSEQSGTRFPTN